MAISAMPGWREQQVLHFLGGDVLAVADDQVLDPAGDHEIPLAVNAP